jgi:predicted nicotinamide N-methyase
MPDRPAAVDAEWAALLARWAIPDELVTAAPEPPYFFDPAVFIAAADAAGARDDDTASDRVAREALPDGGSVLDVGAGAGAASVRLGAGEVIAVDPIPELLSAFADRLGARGATPVVVQGTWPDVAADVPVADVVVCHHVVYNVPALADFVTALTSHARNRVVLELTAEHPMSWLRPYWAALHGLDQPDRPTADDALTVVRALGFDVREERWARRYQMIGETGGHQLLRIARRLCLPTSRHGELRRVLATTPPPAERQVVTAWWPGAG